MHATIKESTFKENSADNIGDALFANADSEGAAILENPYLHIGISNTNFINNRAFPRNGYLGGNGGAIYNQYATGEVIN